MNTWNGIGNLTKDVELRYSGENPIARFTLAINGYANHTDYIPITVFGKQAENCNMYLKKGSKAGVVGRVDTGSYENKEGKKIYTWDVVAEKVFFLDKKDRPATGEEPKADIGIDYSPEDIPF